MVKAAPVPRGCGSRQAGGVYLECGLSPGGLPLESFLVDPPLIEGEVGTPEWFQPHRSPIWYERGGVNHLVIWCGAEHYPNPWDFIEEGRVAGFSRRVPSAIDFSKIGPMSRMIFVHPQAAVTPTQELDGKPTLCPRKNRFVDAATARTEFERVAAEAGDPVVLHPEWQADTRCLGGAKYLATPTADRGSWVLLPCGASYQAGDGAPLALPARAAIFLQTPITGVAMITGHDGKVDKEKAEHVQKAGVPVFESDQ